MERGARLARASTVAGELLPPLGVWALGAALFFRQQLGSGFNLISGDRGDTRLIVVLHEHWMNVLRGDASWMSPNFYHPAPGVLGYSDTFLLDLPIYVPLRWLGLDQWSAFQATLVVLTLIGFMATVAIMRRYLRLSRVASYSLAAVFAFGNNLAQAANHAQLATVHWLPVILLLVWAAGQAGGRAARVALGFGAGALLGLVLYSAFYVGWFTLLAGGIFASVLVVLRARDGALEDVADLLQVQRTTIRAGLAGLLVALVPFALTYVGAHGSALGRPASEVAELAPRPLDVINVGEGNTVWTPVLHRLMRGSPSRLTDDGVTYAVTPILAALVVASGVAVASRRRRRNNPLWTAAVLAAVITAVLLTLLPVEWGGWSLWDLPRAVVPGAKAIRSTGRLQLVTALVGVLAIGGALRMLPTDQSGPGRATRHAKRLVPLALLAVLIEQHSTLDVAQVDRRAELAEQAQIADAPSACTSFFVVAPDDARASYIVVDAMLLAVATGLPTLNGYSGAAPGGYLLDPSRSDYSAQVRSWAESHDVLDGLCRLDWARQTWAVAPFEPEAR